MIERVILMGKYAFVNEKISRGNTYRAYRNIDDPKDCYIEINGETIVKVSSIKLYWSAL